MPSLSQESVCTIFWKRFPQLTTKSRYHKDKDTKSICSYFILFNFFSISWKIVVTWLQAEEHSSKVSIGQTVFDVDGRQEELFSWLESLINSSMECVAVIMAYFWQSIFLCYGKFANIATNKKLAKIYYLMTRQHVNSYCTFILGIWNWIFSDQSLIAAYWNCLIMIWVKRPEAYEGNVSST